MNLMRFFRGRVSMPGAATTDSGVCFIGELKRFFLQNNRIRTLALIELNNAYQVARLIQGNEAEDQLITTVERYIFTFLRDYDCEIAVKIEPNRFAVVLNHDAKAVLGIFETLAETMDQLEVSIADKTYYPKVMTGITPLTPEYRSAELAFSAADEALYQARRMGNSIVKLLLPDDDKLHRYTKSLRLLPVLREGLLKKSFVFYAQPIIPINAENNMSKAEILLRYKAADGRILPPREYLYTAALFNVSREVDLYVLEHCCRFLRDQPSDTAYSINISGATVRYPPFFDKVKQCIRFYGVDSEQICFEITENVADQDYHQASLLMYRLKNELGCQLSLDDIGIGSSNLANLPKYDVDYLKIDGSFVQTLLTEPYSEQVVRFIDAAAKLHQKFSVAEYVEHPMQLQKLNDIGVDYAQGYLTGKPEMLFDCSLD
ncbi:GGDEF domain-containing protein [Methylomarinum sp. Ch1-1]|uniref:GGDEF domain-containing protein n=1 Tax=Methylomarinum roseum TaxID=3067653 RepID=A0AAU7NRH0_9GAMM|nr:GGDEF domain-containing protein [Methylomarinum sp. Ch1-1]MDP4520473.1 GGDEF domain-containing protein [Methylomarinum sp. Ch1-1]